MEGILAATGLRIDPAGSPRIAAADFAITIQTNLLPIFCGA
jgi:hypothetical protein